MACALLNDEASIDCQKADTVRIKAISPDGRFATLAGRASGGRSLEWH